MLATLTRAPSVFSPRRDLAARPGSAPALVLDAMVETGAITRGAGRLTPRAHPAVDHRPRQRRMRATISSTPPPTRRKRLATVNGAAPSADLIVHTTLEPQDRRKPRARPLRARIEQVRQARLHASEAAVVVMKPDGAVAALIGGADYDESRVQPRHAGASPAGLGLQALRLSGGAGERHQPVGRARRRAGGHQRLARRPISAAATTAP